MRILASNPDTLGDLILRQPLYRALLDAGHELMLVVRPGVLAMVPYVAPGARTLVLPYETYAHDVAQHWGLFAGVLEDARAFAPDVLLVAPYRWTQFEEKLAEELPPGVRKIGMTGHLYAGDPYAGAAPESRLRFDAVADVAADQLEIEKNAALCRAVIAQGPAGIDPRVAAGEVELSAARDVLARFGLEAGGYWVACVGGTAHVAIKTWHAESWGRVLGEWGRRFGRRFLFVGLPEEEPATREVIRAMADTPGADETASGRASVWMEPGGTLPQLLALMQLSAGYVGHDTGPMHLAAATGRPVVAVFGGGTWPRFRPAVDPSVAVLVGVPCVGCGWVCSFEAPYCIKSVPTEEVTRAVFDLEQGRITGREARILEPEAALQRRMIREGAAFAQRQVREKAELAKGLQIVHRQREAEAAALNADRAREAAEQRAEVERLSAQVQTVHEQARQAAEAFAANRAEALAAHEAATGRLRAELESRSADGRRLAELLELRTTEIDRFRQDVRGIVARAEIASGNGASTPAGARVEVPAQPPANGEAGAAADAPQQPAPPDDVARLRSAVERLEARVRELTPPPPEPPPAPRVSRKPLRAVLVDWIIGSRQYVRRRQIHLPKVSVVVPVSATDDPADVGATLASVVTQNYHDTDISVVFAASNAAAVQGMTELVRPYEDRIDRVMAGEGSGLAGAVAASRGEVIHVLHPGDVLEPGAVLRAAEYFSTRPRVQAAYSEDARVDANGWKAPAPPRPTPDVYALLEQGLEFREGVFFRRWACDILGALRPQYGLAAEWELWLRLARRFGLRRMPGQLRCVKSIRRAVEPAPAEADFKRAAQAFEVSFGPAGRARCQVVRLSHRAADALRRLLPGDVTVDGRFFFPLTAGGDKRPAADAEPPAAVPGQPVCPLNDRLPDRFLFSTPDTTGGDRGQARRALHHVYYDSHSETALAYPPVALDRLGAMYDARHADGAAAVVGPEPGRASPYAGYRGGLLGRAGVADLLARTPSPYWWLNRPDFQDATADEVLRLLRGLVDRADASVRLLNVGCFDGALLDRFKSETRWQTFGAETNPAAAAAARAKGHTVWEVAAQDAPLALPAGESFDVIFLSNTIEHLQSPLLVLRRLRQLLVPGGLIVFNQPNLDSAHATLFGPTWGHWQVPYHRTLTGRRGVGRLATLADLRVVRLRTRTHPYPTCVSVRLNDLGLAAIVPDNARFPNDVASRGVRLTGWSRLVWDWRGKGDFLYAALKLL